MHIGLESAEYDGEDLIKLASSIELLHTATLIHDDGKLMKVCSEEERKVSTPTDNAHGVLVGDFVYSKAFQLMAVLRTQKSLELLLTLQTEFLKEKYCNFHLNLKIWFLKRLFQYS